MNLFTAIYSGLKWVGKQLDLVPHEIAKVVTITKDVEQDAESLCPQLVAVIDDCGNLVFAAARDAGASLQSAENLVAAIVAAAKSEGMDIPADAAVVAAFNAFVQQVTTKTHYVEVMAMLKKLSVDYDAFGANAKAALLKLEADAKA